jgi:hypothetical protein
MEKQKSIISLFKFISMKLSFWLLIIIFFINCNKRNNNDSVHVNNNTEFPLGYNWQTECSSEKPAFYYGGDGQLKIFSKVNSWAFVATKVDSVNNLYVVKFQFLTGVSGKNKDLDWNNFSTREKIAYIKIIDSMHVEFNWVGFYNTKTKKREFTKNPFDKATNPVILIRCEDK